MIIHFLVYLTLAGRHHLKGKNCSDSFNDKSGEEGVRERTLNNIMVIDPACLQLSISTELLVKSEWEQHIKVRGACNGKEYMVNARTSCSLLGSSTQYTIRYDLD